MCVADTLMHATVASLHVCTLISPLTALVTPWSNEFSFFPLWSHLHTKLISNHTPTPVALHEQIMGPLRYNKLPHYVQMV